MSKKILIVDNISEERKDKNGRFYRLVTLRTPNKERVIDDETGEEISVMVEPRYTRILAWEKRYLDNEPDMLYSAEKGDRVLGSIETREVKPYKIDGREINTFSTAVLGDITSPSFESKVRQAFNRENKEIVETSYQNAPAGEVSSAVEDAAEQAAEEPSKGKLDLRGKEKKEEKKEADPSNLLKAHNQENFDTDNW